MQSSVYYLGIHNSNASAFLSHLETDGGVVGYVARSSKFLLCLMHSLRASSSSWLPSLSPQIHARSYAVSVHPPKVFPNKPLPRVFRDKKLFQYHWYTNILKTSTTSPLVFLQHGDFSAQRLIKLRRDILTAANRPVPSLASPLPATPEPPKLVVVRTSIFGAVLRDYPSIQHEDAARLAESLTGGLAILSLPVLNPPQLQAILRALDRGVPPRKQKTPEELAKELAEKNADPATPGRRVKRQRPILEPELKVVGALIDGQLFMQEGVREVAKLPTLETLRAQIVGLLSAPSAQLAAVLSQASGGTLARTLEGLKKSLEESEGADTGAP